MLQASRRTSLKLIGGAALAAAAMPLPALAQDRSGGAEPVSELKRGTIHSMHPEVRSFTIVWEDLGRVKIKAADLVGTSRRSRSARSSTRTGTTTSTS